MTPSSSKRNTFDVDPLTIALWLLIAGLYFGIFTLLEATREVRRRRRQTRDVIGANTILASHTRRLAGELFDAQVQLQMEVAADVDPDGGFWDELPENSPTGAALAASEGISKVPGRDGEAPCKDCPQ